MSGQLHPWEVDLVRQFISAKVISTNGRRIVSGSPSQFNGDFVTRAEIQDLFTRNTYYINVLDPQYGVPVNTGADATPALQAIINSISAGTLFFPPGAYNISGLIGKSYVDFLGAGGYNSVRFIGTSGQKILTWDTSAANIELVHIAGISFEGSEAEAISASDLDFYLSTFTIEHCFFDAALTECIWGNLILNDINNNIFGLFGTPGTNHRHIYSVGDLATRATNTNYVRHNRFYQSTGPEAIHFEAGYKVSFIDNNIERNENSDEAVRIFGMYGVEFQDNWFEQNAGDHQIRLENDPADINGNYVVPVQFNWFDLSHAGNLGIFVLDGATISLDIERNMGVIADGSTQYMTLYTGIDTDNIGIRTSFGNRFIVNSGSYEPPVRHFLTGNMTGLTDKRYIGVGDIGYEVRDSDNSDKIVFQVALASDHGLVTVLDSGELVKAAISAGATEVIQSQDGAGNTKAFLATNGYVGATDGLKVAGTKVVGAQLGTVSNTDTDPANMAAAINAILSRLRTHGLIAT